MPRWSEATQALYDKLQTWRCVADACDGQRDLPRGSYYRSIAIGRIRRPGAAARHGIVEAYVLRCCDDVTTGYKALERQRRFPMVVEKPLGQAINRWRKSHALTWNQWAERAHELMRRDVE